MAKKGTWSCGSLEPTLPIYLERIAARYYKPGIDKCWIWMGRLVNGYGYANVGYVNGKQKMIGTHRAMYELYIGQIPLNLTVDHLCRDRACGNPKHMRILTLSENLKSKNANAKKTHCSRGHEYTDENTYYGKQSNGGPQRQCRTCGNKRQREYNAKRKALSTTS